MRKLTLMLLLSVFVGMKAQNFEAEFANYFESKDTLNMRITLQKWEKAKPLDSELYTSYLDYYFIVAHDEVFTFYTGKDEGESIQMVNGTPKVAGYLGSHLTIRKPILSRGISKIDEGIRLYPDRLDMRLGEIFVFGQAKEWAAFTGKIIEAIDQSAKNKNKWIWTHNLKKYDGEEVFFSSLQDYQIQLHDTQEFELFAYMKEIADEVLKFYPNHIESLSNLSIVYMTNDEVDKAIEVLLRAETINKKDCIILSSLGYAYKHKGDKAKAMEYYQKTVRYGDSEASGKAREQIKELKKDMGKPNP